VFLLGYLSGARRKKCLMGEKKKGSSCRPRAVAPEALSESGRVIRRKGREKGRRMAAKSLFLGTR